MEVELELNLENEMEIEITAFCEDCRKQCVPADYICTCGSALCYRCGDDEHICQDEDGQF